MNQQQSDMFYEYPSSASRSPGSTRQGYATVGLPPSRPRPLDSISLQMHSPSLYPGDDRSPQNYDVLTRYDRIGSGTMPSTYMIDSNQQWANYGATVATMNGPLNGTGRLGSRTVNRRAALPSTWTDQTGLGLHGVGSMGQMYDGGMSMNGSDHDLSLNTDRFLSTSGGTENEQLIPTAIVIKNIQFQCRKEILQGLMASMNLPQPYAFNYHFDKGVFRGLAFANFSTPEDTAMVISKMNGMDVMGRKLRVEYKKMLPQDERDRIDREKREKRGQLEEQHRAPMPMSQQSALQALGVVNKQASTSPLRDVDLNDPDTLEFYTQLTLFKSDTCREVHIFPPDITPEQRRQIHILAHNMGLEHRSVGEADRRQIQIMKRPQNSPPAHVSNHQLPPNVSWEDHRRGLSRAATFDFAESRVGSGAYHTLGRQGPTLEVPGGSPETGIPSNLRAAKSFADLRTHSPSPAPSGSSYAGLGSGLSSIRYGNYEITTPPNLTPTSAQTTSASSADILASNMASMNIKFDSNASHVRSRDNPGAIGSQRPSANGSSSRNIPERQPRGPEWGEAFSGRSRGHNQGQRGGAVSPSVSPTARY